MTTARYDGQTDWYESLAAGEPHAAMHRFAVALLGRGPGRCLDLGCGTGRAIPLLQETSWTVVGTDVSTDQLAVARGNAADATLVNADAHDLPFADAEFDAVISLFTHTDFDDVGAAFTEAARVLKPGGRFVYVGPHPCFGNPMIARADAAEIPDAVAIVRPGYPEPGWRTLPPEPDDNRIARARRHQPRAALAHLFNAIAHAGLAVERVEEPGGDDLPIYLAVAAQRPTSRPSVSAAT